MQLQVLDLQALGVERAHDLGQVGLARPQANRDALDGGARLAEAREDRGGALLVVGLGRDGLDRGAADLGLQLRRRALGDDPAVVDDPDPVGEDVGLLQVLRRQEDGDAVVLRRAGELRPRARCGSAMSRPVVGSSRKRIRGEWTRASARSSRLFIPPE